MDKTVGECMHQAISDLFPICRSLSGDGNRETLQYLQQMLPDIKIHEVPSGTVAFDWTVPEEWNINDAWIKDETGQKIIDFKKSNLHIVSYSEPFEGELILEELKQHLFTLPEQPDLIPYVSSFYERKWGFCLSHNQYEQLSDQRYYVKIDSSLEEGNMTYGELIIEGKTTKEILLSTYVCHPSMANNELSGPIVAAYIAKTILEKEEKPLYTYRILFVPETIGAIYYLSKHKDVMKRNTVAGYVLTCIGDPGNFSYLQTRRENQLVDRVTMHVFKHSLSQYKIYSYLDRGSDERQYDFPGIDLPVGSLMRSKYGEFPEYHTSADDLSFVTAEALEKSLNMYNRCLEVFEHNQRYIVSGFCEPRLSKYNLYQTRGVEKPASSVMRILHILNYCDGENDLLWIAEKLDCPIWELYSDVDILLENKLLKIIKD